MRYLSIDTVTKISRIGLGTWQFGSRDWGYGESYAGQEARFLPENLERADDLIATLREVADAHSATPAQIALAWVIHSPAVAAIPGASSVEQLESNAAAADIELTDDQDQALRAASARFRPITGPPVLPGLLRARFS